MADKVLKTGSQIESVVQVKDETTNGLSTICSESISELTDKCSYVIDVITTSDFHLSKVLSLSGTSIDNSINNLTAKIQASLSDFSTQITEVIIQSNDKMSATAISFAIFVAIIGAFSAFLFNHWHWKVVRKTNKSHGAGIDLIELIQRLESEALKYWISSYDSTKKEEILISEISIKSMVRQIDSQTKALMVLVGNKKTKYKEKQIIDFPYEIYDLVTGGAFESQSRKSSKRKAMKIAKQCSDAKANISSIIMYI